MSWDYPEQKVTIHANNGKTYSYKRKELWTPENGGIVGYAREIKTFIHPKTSEEIEVVTRWSESSFYFNNDKIDSTFEGWIYEVTTSTAYRLQLRKFKNACILGADGMKHEYYVVQRPVSPHGVRM